MADEWADAINAFDEAIERAKEAGCTKDDLLNEVEQSFEEE